MKSGAISWAFCCSDEMGVIPPRVVNVERRSSVR